MTTRSITQARQASSFPWHNRPSLANEVAQVLRERIFSGFYPAGYPMLQVQLADELKISRTPLRHALNILVSEGLLESAKSRGLVVARPDLDNLEQAYLLREVVDGLAARLAARNAMPQHIQQLRQIIASQQEHADPWRPAAYTRLNVDFHAHILSLANNPYLDTQLPLIRLTSQVFLPAFTLSQERALKAIQEHRDIVDAIECRDAKTAERLSHVHIRKTLEGIENFKKQHAYAESRKKPR